MKKLQMYLSWIVGAMIVFTCCLAFEARADQNNNAKSSLKKPKYSDLCLYVSNMVRVDGAIGTNAERDLGEYSEGGKTFRKYKFTGKAMSIIREMKGYIASVSAVDMDNNGVEDLRFRYTVGTAHCEYNIFLKKNKDGKYDYIEEKGIDVTGGRLCGGAGLSFFRYKGNTYVAIIDLYNEMVINRYSLYSCSKDSFKYECTVNVYSDEIDTTTTCTKPICNVVREKAKYLVNAAKKGAVFSEAEREIEDTDSFDIDWEFLKPFERDGDMFVVDLDNDGVDELLIKQKVPPANRLIFSILKKEKDVYRAINPNIVYKRFNLLGTSNNYLFDDNLVFVKASDKNYIVAIHLDSSSGKSYKLGIFIINKDEVSKIGTINVTSRRLKNNLSYDEN